MRYWVLRKMYTLAWWLCDKTAPSEAPVFKGFYTRFKRPENVRDEELASELKRLLEEAQRE